MRRSFIIFGATSVLFPIGLVNSAPSLDERKEKIQAMENKLAPEALARRARSEKILRAEGVTINPYFPVLDTVSEIKQRPKDQIAYRALSLIVVALKGEGVEPAKINSLIKEYGLEKYLSPKENTFIRNPKASEHDKIQFVWRYEAAWVLLWSLGFIKQLQKPSTICDASIAVKIMRDRSTKQFLSDAKLRPMSEVLDQADLIYRYHWAVVDANLKGKLPPGKLDGGVTMERHYALNWLIGYFDQEWDDISTDT